LGAAFDLRRRRAARQPQPFVERDCAIAAHLGKALVECGQVFEKRLAGQ
jgi:hypothetical protein